MESKIARTDLEIRNCIAQLNKQIASKKFKKIPAEVQKGITEAVRVLNDRDTNVIHIAEHCESVRSRCIAWLAIDYMEKTCERKALLGVYDMELKKLK